LVSTAAGGAAPKQTEREREREGGSTFEEIPRVFYVSVLLLKINKLSNKLPFRYKKQPPAFC